MLRPRPHSLRSAHGGTALLLLLAACGGKSAAPPAAAPAPAGAAVAAPPAESPHPLAALTGEHLIIAPVQRFRALDTLGVGRGYGDPRALLARVDTLVVQSVLGRGVGRGWIFAPDVARNARRNITYAPDSYNLAVQELVRRRSPDEELHDPLATQIRTMAALVEDGRYVLIPAELRTESAGGAARLVLHLSLLDARAAALMWSVEVTVPGDAPRDPARAAERVADRVADLAAAP